MWGGASLCGWGRGSKARDRPQGWEEAAAGPGVSLHPGAVLEPNVTALKLLWGDSCSASGTASTLAAEEQRRGLWMAHGPLSPPTPQQAVHGPRHLVRTSWCWGYTVITDLAPEVTYNHLETSQTRKQNEQTVLEGPFFLGTLTRCGLL